MLRCSSPGSAWMGAIGDSSANQAIDGAFWNANQKLTLLLAVPNIVLLRRTSATGEQDQGQPPHILIAVARTSSTLRSQPLPNVGQVASRCKNASRLSLYLSISI